MNNQEHHNKARRPTSHLFRLLFGGALPFRSMLAGISVPGRVTQARKVKGEKPD